MKISTWEKTRKWHLNVINKTHNEDLPTKLHLTDNSKTDISIDFPPHSTCTPTKVCMGTPGITSAACYALCGHMTYPNAVRCHARNQRLVDHLLTASMKEVQRVADTLYGELPRYLDYLRWNGAGDLTPGSCKLINCFIRRHPDIHLWVITRKPDVAAKLDDRESLHLTFSLDYTTPTVVAEKARLLTQVFSGSQLAYTRTSEDDIPPKDVGVVFNKHVLSQYYPWRHPKVCPATLPNAKHVDACDSCRKCFTR